MAEVSYVSSRDNAWFKDLRKLAHENTHYRGAGVVWIEGEHLSQAARNRGFEPVSLVCTQAIWDVAVAQKWMGAATKVFILTERLFAELSQLGSPAGFGMVFELDRAPALRPEAPTVVLDQIQDAGNVGSILRSAAAFGFTQVLSLKGSAALWSPKVMRAAMGAHFSLHLLESLDATRIGELKVPLYATDPHGGETLAHFHLARPCAWLFGNEGQGLRQVMRALASKTVRIEQPGGEESLNVAACAAICLHASAAGTDTD